MVLGAGLYSGFGNDAARIHQQGCEQAIAFSLCEDIRALFAQAVVLAKEVVPFSMHTEGKLLGTGRALPVDGGRRQTPERVAGCCRMLHVVT